MNTTQLPYILRINPLIIIFGSLLLIIVPFLIWSQYAEIEQRSSTQGIVITTSKTQRIQSAIDGVIEGIMVKEGELVRKGDLLIKLEKSQNKAEQDAIMAKIASLKIKLMRLKTEVYGGKLIYPSNFVQKEYLDFVHTQEKLFLLRQKALNDEVLSLKDSLELKKEELELNKPLVTSGDIGRMKLLLIESEITEIKGKISNVKNKYFQNAQEEMTKAEEELSINQQMLTEKSVKLDRSDIHSYMKAIVKEIIITTKGAKVRPGDIIMELVPLDDDLIIEAKLKPSEVSFIIKGQTAIVKSDAYDFSIYGMFYGKVKYISPDTIIEKTSKGDEHYFKVQIVLDKRKLFAKNGKEIEITPGMGAQVDIITGSRTVFQYMAKPIIKTLDEAFIER